MLKILKGTSSKPNHRKVANLTKVSSQQAVKCIFQQLRSMLIAHRKEDQIQYHRIAPSRSWKVAQVHEKRNQWLQWISTYLTIFAKLTCLVVVHQLVIGSLDLARRREEKAVVMTGLLKKTKNNKTYLELRWHLEQTKTNKIYLELTWILKQGNKINLEVTRILKQAKGNKTKMELTRILDRT